MLKKIPHEGLFILWWMVVVLPAAVMGQTARDNPSPAKTEEIAPAYRQVSYNSSNRRDPFLNPLLFKKADPNEEAPRGSAPPGIRGMYIAQVHLLGTAVSEVAKTAVFEGTDKRVYFLHEGDRLFDGYVKLVTVDNVMLIRETNLNSGKVLSQEITKRLRTP